MSYFDIPNIHFSGTFFTDPSTVNNAVTNFDPDNWTPEKTQSYWNPMGKADFTLKDCKVKSINYDSNSMSNEGENDVLMGKTITVVANPFPGKIVDLDPQQQGCSGLFGVQILLGELDGPYVIGNFETVGFRQLWNRLSSGNKGDIGMGATYQSTLTNLVWNEKGSKYLEELKKVSPERLSIKFALDLYNGAAILYVVNNETMAKMINEGVPQNIVEKIAPLSEYIMYPGQNMIPTSAYFIYLLEKYLTTDEISEYKDKIVEATKQPYTAGSILDSQDMEFTQGRIVGSIGPSNDGEPMRSSWCRMLASAGKYQGINTGPLGYTPFQIENSGKVLLDLSNTLPNKVNDNGQVVGEVDLSTIGNSIEFGYYENGDTSNFTPIQTLTSTELNNNLLMNSGGMLELDLSSEQFTTIQSTPCMMKDGNGDIVLVEEENGYYINSDVVFFRMNPDYDNKEVGGIQELKFYVSQFGQKTSGVKVYADSVNVIEATKIFGMPETATPRNGVELSTSSANSGIENNCLYVESDNNGIASITLTSNNPNNPRKYIDGQLYYISYALNMESLGVSNALFGQNMDGVYVLVFDYIKTVEKPTWKTDIKPFMSQYGDLYPIMKQFNLGDYETVKKYAKAILSTMTLPLTDPNHMPVTRDLSLSRLALFEQWVNTGMAE